MGNDALVQRFLRYTTFDTQSCEDSESVPSTPKQLVFARFLKEEMEREGLQEVVLDEKGYLYATLPATPGMEQVPTIGFISHYDTSPDCSGKDVKARIVRNYDGKDIVLNAECRIRDAAESGMQDAGSAIITTTTEKFPELLQHVGEDIIVTDGTTLLGADDKAGIAEIMQAMCWLRDHPGTAHGKVRIAFNPDEEIGMGAHHFDVKLFGCEWAYTIDGGDEGELEYENFNAASAKVAVSGVSVHPGYAKGKMLNAARIATEFAALLPSEEIPERTEGYEGFFHLIGMEGCCEKAELSYIIRDHDRKRFEERKGAMLAACEEINARYGAGTCHVTLKDQYYNMLEKVHPVRHIVSMAEEAMRQAGVESRVQPIRGGTDGAQLSFQGLPCPNIFTGAVNFHGPHEFVSVQVMEKAMQTIINIITTVS